MSKIFLSYVRQDKSRASTQETIVSPQGRYRLVLIHDHFLGQTESLVVSSPADSRRGREIFRQTGDQPFAFVYWREDGAAVLNVAGDDGSAVREEVLRCAAERCTLEP